MLRGSCSWISDTDGWVSCVSWLSRVSQMVSSHFCEDVYAFSEFFFGLFFLNKPNAGSNPVVGSNPETSHT